MRQVCALLQASTLPNARKDVARFKHVSAFTQGNDLPWNRQTLFRFQGAEQASSSLTHQVRACQHAQQGCLYLHCSKAGGFTQPLVSKMCFQKKQYLIGIYLDNNTSSRYTFISVLLFRCCSVVSEQAMARHRQ